MLFSAVLLLNIRLVSYWYLEIKVTSNTGRSVSGISCFYCSRPQLSVLGIKIFLALSIIVFVYSKKQGSRQNAKGALNNTIIYVLINDNSLPINVKK